MRTGQLYLSRRRRARARGRGFCDPAIRLLVMGNPITLSVDCGGGGIKASVLDAAGTMIAQPVRTSTPYPLPPELLIKVICDLAADLPAADRVTVGMPGMIRHGVVIATPHYVTKAGPRTKALPDLVEEWSGFDMRRHLSRALDRPVMVLNDAEVHGSGDRKSTRLNSSHVATSYAVFCLQKQNVRRPSQRPGRGTPSHPISP